MAKLHWLVTFSLVALSWLDIGTDVFAITQYAALAQQQRDAEWKCSNNQVWLSSSSKPGSQHSSNPFRTQTCPTGSSPAAMKSPPYSFAFQMCLYLTGGLCIGHILVQAVMAMYAVRHRTAAEYADECLGSWPVLPYLTAFVRGLVMWEPAYQFLNMYSPPNSMEWEAKHLYEMHAQQVFVRLRLAEAVFKGPCMTVALYALILQALARSSSAQQYLPRAAFATAPFSNTPLIAATLSVAVGTISLVVFATTYALSQRQSLWGSAKPVQCRGPGKAVSYAAGVGTYSLCSVGSRALAVAAAVASIMLDDSTATPAYYLPAGSLGALVLLGWVIYAAGSCFSVSSASSSGRCARCIQTACRAFVSAVVVQVPWNAAPTACKTRIDAGLGAAAPRGAGGQQSVDNVIANTSERKWWPSAAFAISMCMALLAAGLVLSVVVGGHATCYAACNASSDLRGGDGNIVFAAACGVVVGVLAVWELLLFAVLSRTAPARPADDWNDDFIETEPYEGKA